MNAPCYKCEDRSPACHDGCERYKEWKSVEDKKKEHVESIHNESDEFLISNVMRQQRRNRR
jgi:hypothetical protein